MGRNDTTRGPLRWAEPPCSFHTGSYCWAESSRGARLTRLPIHSGFWSFLWFVGFCFLTNQWQRTAPGPGTTQAGDAARAAIAFSFFSILSWVRAAFGL